MAHIKGSSLVPPPVKRKITIHKERKLQFYNNDEDREYKTEEQVKHAELRLFREILDAQDKAAEQQVVQLNQRIANPKARQIRLDGTVETTPQMALEAAELRRQVVELEGRRKWLQETRQALQPVHDVPFVWDIAFVEVFEGDSDGFDIVVGNPPYVRQEKIADPRERQEDFTADEWRERRKAYKAKLARSVYQAHPGFFRYDPARDAAANKIDSKSDLYVYFYLHALSLLNPRGSFSFVTSNSWLDVGYGADLQEFVLRNCRVRLILDNQVRRTFADADVNTVIVLFSAPQRDEQAVLAHTARFVMFTVPFEQVVDAVIFEEIEEATGRRTTPDYRVFPIVQRRLLEAGCRLPEEDEGGASHPGPALQAAGKKRQAAGKKGASGPLIRVPRYTGDKWGGKYLRAPDIYWRILEKGKDKLARLGDVAEVRRGFTTGANDFFHVLPVSRLGEGVVLVRSGDGSEHAIEDRFVQRRVIVKASEIVCPRVEAESLRYRLVLLPGDGDLPRHAASYVAWGEAQGFSTRPSTRGRNPWYAITEPPFAPIAFPTGHKRRGVVGWVPPGVHIDKRLYRLTPKELGCAAFMGACLLSTFGLLEREVGGYANFGQGLLELSVGDTVLLRVLDAAKTPAASRARLEAATVPLL
ncbi:MAG TPA: Eco57I restriction-modification methylase domain-containing protein, partial [Armatimonadota bacterium]|nr:Eco57I restriction-modification methylase domain-containing protein [Armatimonadota bacterium]